MTVVDAPGHHDFIKNMISGASAADAALLLVPADGNFAASICKGNPKTGQVMGSTRQHALLVNLLGVKQLIVAVNKMDMADFAEERYREVSLEATRMLISVGVKPERVTFLPLSGLRGDNLLEHSPHMPWWTGPTLVEAIDALIVPERRINAPMVVPIAAVVQPKGVGTVVTGRVEQGTVEPGTEVCFLPTHTSSSPCTGKVFTVEMHRKSIESARPGDNVGICIRGLAKGVMPRTGDVMVLRNDDSFASVESFCAQVHVLSHPGSLKVGYTPIGFVRTGRSALRLAKIVWKMGKETGGQKLDSPNYLRAGDIAEVIFEPQQPLVVASFKDCEGLGRIAILEGGSCVMLGKVLSVNKNKSA